MFSAVYVINIVIAVLVIIDLGLFGDGFFFSTVNRLRQFNPKEAAYSA